MDEITATDLEETSHNKTDLVLPKSGVLEENSAQRRIARARRFGIKPEPSKIEPMEELPDIPDAEVRPEAVHLHGTNEMSTEDVLCYFEGYSPANIEWINDSSCNVVWNDSSSALQALLGTTTQLATPYEGTTERSPRSDTPAAGTGGQADRHEVVEQTMEADADESWVNGQLVGKEKEVGGDGEGTGDLSGDLKEKEGGGERTERSASSEEVGADSGGKAIRSESGEEEGDRNSSEEEDNRGDDSMRKTKSVRMQESGGGAECTDTLCWRCGEPHPKADRLLLRLATEADVKERGAARKSTYYKKYGRPEYGMSGNKSTASTRSNMWSTGTWREEEGEEEEKQDLRVRIGKKHSIQKEQDEAEEAMEVDEETSPFAALAKRPKPLHSDRPDDSLDVTELMDESEKQRRLDMGGALTGGHGDLRRALQQRKKRRNLKLRLGHTPRLVERTD